MSEYIADRNGKWLVQDNLNLLVEPSEEYLQQRYIEEQQRLEQQLLESLKPSEKEVLMAEVELNTITLLLEVGLL